MLNHDHSLIDFTRDDGSVADAKDGKDAKDAKKQQASVAET